MLAWSQASTRPSCGQEYCGKCNPCSASSADATNVVDTAATDKALPNAAPAAYPLDDACDDDDDVEEAPVFMVRLKNEDALDELNEEVEDSAANTQDLAAKTARFAALLNMMIPQSILKRGDTTSA